MQSKTLVLAGTVLALLGCTVGPDYQKPETPVPQNWISQQTDAKANATQEAWWQNFHDPVLTELIEKAASGNWDIKIAEARIDEARASHDVASAALLPTGDFKGTAVRQANQVAFPGGNSSGFSQLLHKPYNTYQTGFDASWNWICSAAIAVTSNPPRLLSKHLKPRAMT
jgi:outer membrane protein TolC